MSTNAYELAASATDKPRKPTSIPRYDTAVTPEVARGVRRTISARPSSRFRPRMVPAFRVAGVAGHGGVLRSIHTASGMRVLAIGARTHFDESHGVDAVVHGARTAVSRGAHAP